MHACLNDATFACALWQEAGIKPVLEQIRLAPHSVSGHMITTLLADDHAAMRRGLKQLLEETSDIVVGAEASSTTEALAEVRARRYDVVVLDISMPGGNGLELLEEIKRTNPALPVLVLSMYPPDQYARRILEAGAAGYLPKERASEELVDAIRHIHAGGIYISRRPIPAGSDGEVTHHSLSEREYTIMLSLAAGRTVPQIAKSHRLSLGTVERSRKSIFAKMRLRSNADLTRYAIRHRLGLV